MKQISILIPAYNEEEVLPAMKEALEKVTANLSNYTFEFLFINDGSTDRTQEMLHAYHLEDSRVRYIELSRNFGKEKAMLAGFDYAKGDAIIIMDADLQHPPSMIEEMLYWWEQGYEDVYTVRKEKAEKNAFRKWTSDTYYKVLSRISEQEVYKGAGDFRLLDRKCVEALKELRESERNTKGLYAYIGFKKKALEYDEAERVAGETKWRLSELIRLAIDGITSYTTAPLRMWSILGMLISILSFIYLAYELYHAFVHGSEVAGYPSLLAAIVFLGGVQLISLGAIGEYLARVFIETKQRPVYFVRETTQSKIENEKEKVQNDDDIL